MEFRQDFKSPKKLVSTYTRKGPTGRVALHLQQVFYLGGMVVGGCSFYNWQRVTAGLGYGYPTSTLNYDQIVKLPPSLAEKVLNEDWRVKTLNGL